MHTTQQKFEETAIIIKQEEIADDIYSMWLHTEPVSYTHLGGLIVLAFGVLAVVLVVWIFGGFLPWALKGIWKLCKKPFNKRKERAAA